MTTIVMTGGTSGLGKVAVNHLRGATGVDLVVGSRGAQPPGTTALPLDLARLDTVRSFAELVGDHLGERPIQALVLNAGVSFHRGDQRTADGFETTFAVNHLAHYLLLRLLLPRMAHRGRVVITTSSTHDAANAGLVPPPRHADAKLLAHPDLDPEQDDDPKAAGGRAYTSSKLCNLLTARGVIVTAEAVAKDLRVIAYDPGPTPGTGLSRNFSPAIRATWAVLGSPVGRLLPRLSSRDKAGATLAELALGGIAPPAGEYYASLHRGRLTWAVPSELARDDNVRDALWRDSASMVGITG